MTVETDPVVVMYYAYLHDSCRENEDGDSYHGARAAEWIVNLRDSMLKNLTDDQFEKLQIAVVFIMTPILQEIRR